jgi:hypothetical protein
MIAKNVEIRITGATQRSLNDKIDTPIVGWFSNQYNPVEGWVLHELEVYDREWLKEAGLASLEGVFRTHTGTSDSTSIVLIKPETGFYAFLNNKELTETGVARFERLCKARKIIFDSTACLIDTNQLLTA